MAAIDNPISNEAELTRLPLGELWQTFTRDAFLLLRQEVALAKKEVDEKVEQAKARVAAVAAGAVLLFVGGLVLVASAVLALALVLPAWAAALLVASVLCIAGAVLLRHGQARLAAIGWKPERTAANVKQDADMLKGAL